MEKVSGGDHRVVCCRRSPRDLLTLCKLCHVIIEDLWTVLYRYTIEEFVSSGT